MGNKLLLVAIVGLVFGLYHWKGDELGLGEHFRTPGKSGAAPRLISTGENVNIDKYVSKPGRVLIEFGAEW